MRNFEEKIEKLKEYFLAKHEIIMTFIFGSYAKNRVMSESDFDIAVYFKPENAWVEYEKSEKYPQEDEIRNDVENIIGVDTDLIVLNRANVSLADEILQTGTPLIVKDRLLYIDFLLAVSREAEDYRKFVRDFWMIKQRSLSLYERDKLNLLKRIDFLQNEIAEFSYFKKLDFKVYESDRKERRNVERWIENIVNASIDIAKILLASKKEKIPERYKDALKMLSGIEGFNEESAVKMAEFAELRNILTHEYLDMRFEKIKKFVQEAEFIYKELIDFVNKLLE